MNATELQALRAAVAETLSAYGPEYVFDTEAGTLTDRIITHLGNRDRSFLASSIYVALTGCYVEPDGLSIPQADRQDVEDWILICIDRALNPDPCSLPVWFRSKTDGRYHRYDLARDGSVCGKIMMIGEIRPDELVSVLGRKKICQTCRSCKTTTA